MKEIGILKDICYQLYLGSLKGIPTRFYGGYMHKMYRVDTNNGNFAIKLLNPIIMKRKNVFDNFI